MGALLAKGHVRLQPASYFAATDHNGAIRDDELNLGVSLVVSKEEWLPFFKDQQDLPADIGDQVLHVNYQSDSDYWLYCLTRSLDPRLFVDFNANACVIIKNRKAFAERLQQTAAVRLPNNTSLVGEAMYVDPHQPTTAMINLPLAKHFRYSYQKEFRFAWMPEMPSEALTHIDVEMGSLDDIAELILI
jgi:hypothetical protein